MAPKTSTARPDIDFWHQRYLTGNTPWDNGQDAAACTAGLFEADVLTWTPPLPLQGPPYHCDINAMHALFPGDHWVWPEAPFPRGDDGHHLSVVLQAIGPGAVF